ncbi:MAG: hypothetical protein EXX96DRAFT_577458 [Benjaminiella poitrasii]|nr:MAG: hypothetical protein EXX96DRAFT_577458 [Benjaminiella poitrasii]
MLLKYLVIFVIFCITNIAAQDGLCGGKGLTAEQSVHAWKCVGLLKQRQYSFDEYTAVETSGPCTCRRIGPINDDGVWDEMNQCAAPGGNHVGGSAMFHYDEGEGCWGNCQSAFCYCWVLSYECTV